MNLMSFDASFIGGRPVLRLPDSIVTKFSQILQAGWVWTLVAILWVGCDVWVFYTLLVYKL